MEDSCIYVDHASGRQFQTFLLQRAAGFSVKLAGKHSVRCRVLGRRDAMAPWDYFQVPVAECKTVQVIENLHVVLVAFCQVDGVPVLPVMMVLVIAKRADAARRDV